MYFYNVKNIFVNATTKFDCTIPPFTISKRKLQILYQILITLLNTNHKCQFDEYKFFRFQKSKYFR